jgi:hypothetical protein
VEREELRGCVAAEAMQLSCLVEEITDALIDLGVFPTQGLPTHLELAQDVLTAASLILEHLREEHASTPVPGSKTWPIQCRYSPRLSRLVPFFAFGVYVMYISIFLHMLMYKDIKKIMSLHPHVHAPVAAVSWSSKARVRHPTHHRRGAPIVDHHDCIFSEKVCCVTLIRDLVNFHVSGEGSRGHEILHHVVVPELVLDEVGVVWASLLNDLIEVIHGQTLLTLSTACDGRGVHHDEATRLLVVATIITDRGCDFLMALLSPLLAAHPDILDDDVGRCFPTAAWGRVKLGCLIPDGVLGADAAQLLNGVLDSVSRCQKGSYQRHVSFHVPL